MKSPQNKNSKRNIAMISSIPIIILGVVITSLFVTGAIQTSSSTNASDMGMSHALEYGVDVDWPLSPEFQNIVQLIIVKRGDSVMVPIRLTGSGVSNINIPVTLVAENIGKLNETGQVQGEPPIAPPTGVQMTFSQPIVTVRSSETTDLDMTVTVSSQSDTGTYAFEILGKSTGREIGTTIYVRIV